MAEMETATLQRPRIGAEEVRQAAQILKKYKQGKAHLESRIIDNEQFWKMRHWQQMEKNGQGGNPADPQPTSGWLVNCILSKHADAMDCYPEPTVLPREEGDRMEAGKLTKILPVVLKQNQFKRTYSDAWWYKLKSGCAAYGVFWDAGKLGGLGDIAIRRMDLLNLFWEPGVRDIQDSENFFSTELVSNAQLLRMYPQLEGKLGGSALTVSTYQYDDGADTTGKSAVVDWYYKRRQGGRVMLHYCKFVGDTVLFATENEPEYASRGWYDHGKYPFLFDPLFSVEGSPCGFGYIDVGKSAQEYIDRGNQAILQNLLANTRPRYFIRSDGAVNEEEYGDYTRDFVHVDGNLGQDSVLPISGKPLSSIYVEVISRKIDELKEVTGNRDVSTGGTVSGVTAASAIAAMQEAGSKLSRDHIRASYRVFRQVCEMMIELIRQFYTLPRAFRIVGAQGAEEFVRYSNQGLLPQSQGVDFGVDLGMRVPLFDIQISAQKQNPYSKMSQNEMAMSFYTAGFFDPQRAQEALACLDMMDFERKDMVAKKIAENARAYRAAALEAAGAVTPMPSEPAATRQARTAAARRGEVQS